MKAITIRQPWAWCILEAGKNIENRSWNTNYRGRFLIHTSKKVDKETCKFLKDCGETAFGLTKPLPTFNNLVTGCLVGSAVLEYSCRLREVPRKDGQWADLRTDFCWKLSHMYRDGVR